MLKLNETPVRTARNFNINNIKIDEADVIYKNQGFDNIEINGIDIDYVSDDVSKCDLVYGVSESLLEEIENNANHRLKLMLSSNSNVEILNTFDEDNISLIDNIEIVANENTTSSILIKYQTEEDLKYYHNGVIRVHANNNAKVNVTIVNFLNGKSSNFLSIENDIQDNANVNYIIVDFGGKNSITNYYSNIKGQKADSTINTIYLGKENQMFDINYIGELWGKQSNLDIDVQGAIKDNARKHFKGTIDFKRGCKKATGNENEYCTILSDTAKSIALPMLLCEEEDVEGNHATSAGKIGEKELFYIMSRGFELKEALKLMLRAKFNKVLENIPVEELKEQIITEMETRLD